MENHNKIHILINKQKGKKKEYQLIHDVLQDAIPMVQNLKFEPIFKPAIMQVFGKTLICRDMDKASQFAKSADMDCITLEGLFCVLLTNFCGVKF